MFNRVNNKIKIQEVNVESNSERRRYKYNVFKTYFVIIQNTTIALIITFQTSSMFKINAISKLFKLNLFLFVSKKNKIKIPNKKKKSP